MDISIGVTYFWRHKILLDDWRIVDNETPSGWPVISQTEKWGIKSDLIDVWRWEWFVRNNDWSADQLIFNQVDQPIKQKNQ